MTKCGKCNGSGNLKEYGHVANGVCFECNGSGLDNGIANGKKSYELWTVNVAKNHFVYVSSGNDLQALIDYALGLSDMGNMEITKTRKSGDSGRTVWNS